MRAFQLLILLGTCCLLACDPVSPPDDPITGDDDTTATDPGYPYLFAVTLEETIDPATRAFYLAYDPFNHSLLGWAEAVIGEEVTVEVPEGYVSNEVDFVSIWITDDGSGALPRVSVIDRRKVPRRSWTFGNRSIQREYDPALGLRSLGVEDQGAIDPSNGNIYVATRGASQHQSANELSPYAFEIPKMISSLEGQPERLFLNQHNRISGRFEYGWLELPGDNAITDTATLESEGWIQPDQLSVDLPGLPVEATTTLFGYVSEEQAYQNGYLLLTANNFGADFSIPSLADEFAAFRHLTTWETNDGITEFSKQQSYYTTSQPNTLPLRRGSVAILDSTFDTFSFNITGDEMVVGRAFYRTYEEDPENGRTLAYSWTIESPPGTFEAFNYQLPGAITSLSGYFNRDPRFFSASALAYPAFIDYTTYQRERQAVSNLNDFANYELTTYSFIGVTDGGISEKWAESGGFIDP
ncbi:MAG TPA: hypothetical protein DCE41_36065 [Cytophagales bacterium]|nr:hypothetical protein [Cytophagales bacterium]HAA17695.1 hypothetical protein [Cytophagales bacterium]HAP62486.1 hypothetical protein [Cytophagales bacterium]